MLPAIGRTIARRAALDSVEFPSNALSTTIFQIFDRELHGTSSPRVALSRLSVSNATKLSFLRVGENVPER